MTLEITEGIKPDEDLPPDNPPMTSGVQETGWFDPEYPHSTEDHPYGFFMNSDGSPDYNRPRKRRPHGRRSASGTGSTATSATAERTARTAAVMLARMNSLLGIGLYSFGMPVTRDALLQSNEVFEQMAFEALCSDPALARKILAAGASSGKAQLVMAYAMLGGSVAPVAFQEIKTRRQELDNDAAAR